jgi:hypothetical protein
MHKKVFPNFFCTQNIPIHTAQVLPVQGGEEEGYCYQGVFVFLTVWCRVTERVTEPKRFRTLKS